jgi:PIN domain nuclease of toxin-antitoxin system
MNCFASARKKRDVVKYVLDASAVLALLQREPGHQRVEKMLVEAGISAVNLCEVASKLAAKGLEEAIVRPELLALGLEVIPCDEAVAFRAARIHAAARPTGLSLGDSVCLASAAIAGAVAVTTDRAWSRLKGAPRVQQIR